MRSSRAAETEHTGWKQALFVSIPKRTSPSDSHALMEVGDFPDSSAGLLKRLLSELVR